MLAYYGKGGGDMMFKGEGEKQGLWTDIKTPVTMYNSWIYYKILNPFLDKEDMEKVFDEKREREKIVTLS